MKVPIKDIKKMPEFRGGRKFKINHLGILWRSLKLLKKKECRSFLFKAMKARPDMATEIVRMIIEYHHFNYITQKMWEVEL